MTQPSAGEDWSATMFRQMADSGVDLFAYVPDAGNKRLIECADASNEVRTVLLTTEEEGLAICAGADLVGKRAVLCMQSSGLGNSSGLGINSYVPRINSSGLGINSSDLGINSSADGARRGAERV